MAKVSEEIKELEQRINILKDAPEEWGRGSTNKYIKEVLQRELQKALSDFYDLKTGHKIKREKTIKEGS
jgi:hypothetical protein